MLCYTGSYTCGLNLFLWYLEISITSILASKDWCSWEFSLAESSPCRATSFGSADTLFRSSAILLSSQKLFYRQLSLETLRFQYVCFGMDDQPERTSTSWYLWWGPVSLQSVSSHCSCRFSPICACHIRSMRRQ